ncbi:MAG: hypothetical protein WCA10_19510 [Terracidiphilus sp.]
MTKSDQHQVTDKEARRLAKGLVVLFSAPLRVMEVSGLEKPLTIADMIRMGGTILGGLNAATTNDSLLKEKNREFILKVCELVYVPDELEEFLFGRIVERRENAGDINEAISQVEGLMSGPGATRRFLKEAIAGMLPKGPRGRPTQFNPDSDPDRFLALSSRLMRVCGQLLNLRELFPKKTNKELADFLKTEDPKGAEFVQKHEGFISQTLRDLDFRVLKAHKTRVQRLADAIAGRELFHWTFKYAVQRGGEIRRFKGIEREE